MDQRNPVGKKISGKDKMQNGIYLIFSLKRVDIGFVKHLMVTNNYTREYFI